jgi:23S rRNA pseudouridine1911/1915/1917 synthase
MASEREPLRVTYRAAARDAGRRLDLFLKEKIPRMSRERVKQAIRTRVSIAGRPSPRPSTELATGDEVIVTMARTESAGQGALPPPAVSILHEDADLLAVDKPAGLLVHGTSSSKGPTLLGILAERIGGDLHLVHRLDRDTSGVVVLARNPEAGRTISEAFAGGRVRKRYLAIVFGEVSDDRGAIDLPLGPAAGSAIHIKQGVDDASGRPARTDFRVLERFGDFTLLDVAPRTGRRHQIRVHLQAIGHPVVGDRLYGARESHHLRFIAGGFDDRMRRELLAERQLLHAARMEIDHPTGAGRLRIEAPAPADMLLFMEARRAGEGGR